MSTTTATTANFDSLVSSNTPTLVEFGAAWCGPCRKMAPVLDALAAAHPDFTVATVDIDDEPALAQAHQVTGVPTFMVFNTSGELVERWVGPKPQRVLVEALEGAR